MSKDPSTNSAKGLWLPPLLWKEIKQTTPLITMILCSGIALTLVVLLFEAFAGKLTAANWDRGHWLAYVALPMFFATGVGVLLVGSEKENRTLLWLRSLPISSRDIAWNKIVAMLITLVIVWVAAFAIFCFAGLCHGAWPLSSSLSASGSLGNDPTNLWLLPNYLMVSLFLAFAGFALAWRFESPLVALVMIVPVALSVWLAAYGISELLDTGAGYLRDRMETSTYLGLLVLGTGYFVIDGWRTSQRQLSANPHSTSWLARLWQAIPWGATSDSRAIAERGSNSLQQPVVTPIAGMLWQTYRQHRWWWTAFFVFCAIGVAISAGIPNDLDFNNTGRISKFEEQIAAPWLYFAAVAISWLGVFAFQGDNLRERARFYADRGVSPKWLWMTRHWIPILLLVGLTAIRTLARLNAELPYQSFSLAMLVMDSCRFFAIALAIYAVGQGISHWLNSPVIATIVASVSANAMLFYCIFALIPMEAPWWLIPVPFVALLAATYWLMQDWMERKFNWQFKAKHAAFAFVGLLIPIIPGIVRMATLPNISSSLRSELTSLSRAESLHAITSNRAIREMPPSFFSPPQEFDQATGAFGNNEALHRDLRAKLMQPGWDIATYQRWIDFGGIKLCTSEILALRNEIEYLEGTTDSQKVEAIKQYQAILRNLPKFIRELRGSQILRYCDDAEELEIALLNECRHPKNRERMGETLYAQLVQLLCESDQRDRARRIALANAWKSNTSEVRLAGKKSNKTPDIFGGYSSYVIGSYGANENLANVSFITSMRMLRSRGVFTQDVWDLLNLDKKDERHAMRKKIASNLGYYYTPSDVYGDLIALSNTPTIAVPCKHWRGDWEFIAKELSTTLTAQPTKAPEVENE